MKNRFEHNRFADFSLNYHMVWSTAFNRKVIDDDVAEVVLRTIRSKSEELGVTIHEIEVVDQCNVECYFSAPPKICLTDYLKAVKPASTKRPSKHTRNSGGRPIIDIVSFPFCHLVCRKIIHTI